MVILTGLTACDNVNWGGVQFALLPPPPARVVATDSIEDVYVPPPPLEVGPALYLVSRTPSAANIMPVAILENGELAPVPTDEDIPDFSSRFVQERMSANREFVLFSGGMRAGTFYPADEDGGADPGSGDSADGDSAGGSASAGSASPGAAGAVGAVGAAWCVPRPQVGGRVELAPDATGVERFLALPSTSAESIEYTGYEQIESTRDQRVASLTVASALFVIEEILWPPSVLGARADVQVFHPAGADSAFLAATFLYGDSLAVGGALPNAYSLFFLGEPDEPRYRATYVRYREVGVDGKGAARFIDHMDWNRDGRADVLLEVFGETGHWFAAVTREGTGWRETFEERCAPTPTAASVASNPAG